MISTVELENTISLANGLLFLGALFGTIASFSQPIRSPYNPSQGRDRWDLPLWKFAAYLWLLLLIILLAPHAGDLFSAPFIDEEDEAIQARSIAATLAMQAGLISIILLAIYQRGWSLRSFFLRGGISWLRVIRHSGHLFLRFLPTIWLVGLFWGGLLLAIKHLGFEITPEPQIAAQWIAESNSMAFLLVMGFMVVIAAPFSEELLFRGFLYRFLNERFPAKFALIFSSLLFALLHASLHSFLPLLFIGLLLVKIYEDTNDIRIPMLFHLYFNLFSFLNLIFLP